MAAGGRRGAGLGAGDAAAVVPPRPGRGHERGPGHSGPVNRPPAACQVRGGKAARGTGDVGEALGSGSFQQALREAGAAALPGAAAGAPGTGAPGPLTTESIPHLQALCGECLGCLEGPNKALSTR